MKNISKGFILPVAIVLVVGIIVGFGYFYSNGIQSHVATEIDIEGSQPVNSSSSISGILNNTQLKEVAKTRIEITPDCPNGVLRKSLNGWDCYVDEIEKVNNHPSQISPNSLIYIYSAREYDSEQINLIHADTGRKVTIFGENIPACSKSINCELMVVIGEKSFPIITPSISTSTISFIPSNIKDGMYNLYILNTATGVKSDPVQVKIINITRPHNSEITFAKRKDPKSYDKKVIDFITYSNNSNIYDIFHGTDDFIYETISTNLNNPNDNIEKMRKAAQLAADEIVTQTFIQINNFKVVGENAYVELNIETDGWAGVSYTLYTVRPLIRETLLQFKDIKNVYFGPNNF